MGDRFTMLLPESEYRRLAAELVGRPPRFLPGGNNKGNRFSDWRLSPGDVLYLIRVAKGEMYVLSRARIACCTLRDAYLLDYSEDREAFQNGCANEAVVFDEATPFQMDARVPPEVLERLRFKSKSAPGGQRGLRHLVDGKLKRTVELQGIYRLTDASAEDFDRILAGETQSDPSQRTSL